jgi:outer membrane protein assembly factor BamB
MSSGYLYIGCNGQVAAINPGDGREMWRTKLKSGLLSATTHKEVCLLEHEGRLYAGCFGHLFCLEAGSGRILWHNELKGMGYTGVTLAMADKAVQYVVGHDQPRSTSD